MVLHLTRRLLLNYQRPMSDADATLRDAVEAFVAQLKIIFQQSALEKVQSALGGEAPRGKKRGRPTKVRASAPRARRKGEKRAPDQLAALVKQLLSYVAKNPGQRIEQIGKAIGTPTKELALPAKKLIGEKKLTTKGQKRATTYFAK